MVADVHRTLVYGGIFMYPANKKSPNGKVGKASDRRLRSSVFHWEPGAHDILSRRVLRMSVAHSFLD